MPLNTYRKKRNFAHTEEPRGRQTPDSSAQNGHLFVVQKHAASHLHYDFRLELDGVLKSWAIPKGPHLNPQTKSLAIEVEDHPLEYANFEGTIPAGEYGGGTVMIWDRGTWESDEDPQRALAKGKLSFELHGEKLAGGWSLVRIKGKADDQPNWLLIKKQDQAARPRGDILKQQPLSVVSGRDLDEIASANNGSQKSTAKSASRKHRSRTALKHPSAAKTLSGAHNQPLPDSFAPQLATLASTVPEGDGWLHEVKYDGYRLIAILDHGKVRLCTRTGKDWTDRFPKLAEEVQQTEVATAIFDGEVVVLNREGRSDFQRLQNWLKSRRGGTLAYFVFDLPYLNGQNLQQVPLGTRKKLLEEILPARANQQRIVRFGGHITGQGAAVLEQACKLQAEGIVSKRIDSTYQQRRTKDWLKIKCSRRQEFVVVGFTKPKGSRSGFGALLLAYYRTDELVYCGRVGTGFTEASLKQISQELKKLRRDSSPFRELPPQEHGSGVTWVKPVLVCEVQFTEWSNDGLLRHPSFQGLRADKPAREVKREDSLQVSPGKAPQHSRSASSSMTPGAKTKHRSSRKANTKDSPGASQFQQDADVAGVHLTHPDRVLYPEQGLTKYDLATFYRDIADWILPHLVDRPLTVVRCPDGRSQSCFYQKHLTTPMPQQVHGVKIKEKSKSETYMLIEDLSGLIALVQMGVLELHPWPARKDKLDRPDRLVFDLDPGDDLDWKQVLAAAEEIREQLDQLGLISFVRTSGGKGLHVVLPLVRRNTWEELKGFAQQFARGLEKTSPDRYIATMTKSKRRGKIFIDYLRNQRGATAIASYSTRAKADAPVATPLSWNEMSLKITANHFRVSNLRERLAKLKQDPWQDFFDVRQSLTKTVLQSVGA